VGVAGYGISLGYAVNHVLGSFVIGLFGTLTASGGRLAVPDDTRIFVMVGVCAALQRFRPLV